MGRSVAVKAAARKEPAWRRELASAVESVDRLQDLLGLPAEDLPALRRVTARHPVRVTRYYLGLLDRSDPDDPLRRLMVPSLDELDTEGSYDTGNERGTTVLSGLQHKFPSTALFLATNQCAAYCRYCFRKQRVGRPEEEDFPGKFQGMLGYLRAHPEINNVLLSGGDPLMLPTETLLSAADALSRVPTLNYLRFGTKLPVVLPQRILEDDALVSGLGEISRNRKQIYLVTHFNHPRELAPESAAAVRRLREAGLALNNQTVLLRGVNDRPAVLAELMRRLVSAGVHPYYVFQCRPVKRVMNRFQIPLVEGAVLVETAKGFLDGLSKRFKYVLSHAEGKIEVLGRRDRELWFRFHEARRADLRGRLFALPADPGLRWLEAGQLPS